MPPPPNIPHTHHQQLSELDPESPLTWMIVACYVAALAVNLFVLGWVVATESRAAWGRLKAARARRERRGGGPGVR